MYIDELYAKFDSFGDRIALLDHASGRRLSFTELKRLTGQVASGLARRGFGKGHILCLFGANCLENAPVAHGAIVAGGTLHLVKPLASPDELRFHLELAPPQVIVTTSGTALDTMLEAVRAAAIAMPDVYVIGGAAKGCRGAEELLEDPGDANPWGHVQIDPEDVAVMMQTGGTTGMSKTVPATHEALKLSLLEGPDLEPQGEHEELSLGYIPFSHAFSVSCVYGRWLHLGCGVVNVNSYDPETLLKAIESQRVTRVAITPTALMSVVSCAYFRQAHIPSLRRILCSGAAMDEYTMSYFARIFSEKCPKAVINQTYGMTEMAGLVSAFHSSNDPNHEKFRGSNGRLYPSYQLRIVSCDESSSQGNTAKGEIRLRSPRTMKGYFKNEEATRNAFRDGWYCTGDYGYINESGYVYVVDRIEDLIKHNEGIVLPTFVEGVLRSHPGIKDCAVIGQSCEHGGEVAMAFVVRQEGGDVTAEEVQSFAAARLASHERPTGGVRFVENIPKSPAGKMLRRLLRDRQGFP